MATVNGYTAARMKQIEDESIVDGHVDDDTLVLTARDGTQIVAGVVKGPQGDPGDPALPPNLGTNGTPGGNTVEYVRVGVVDGINDLNGSQLIFDFNGGSNFGETNVYSAKVHVGQRGTDNIKVEVFEKGNPITDIEWYTRKLSPFVFEIWVKLPLYHGPIQIQPLLEWHGNSRYDSQTTEPGSLVKTGIEVFQAFEQNAKALLDPTYKGPGPARVSFLPGGSLSTEYYQMEGNWRPWDNRVVNMKRRNGTWVITGPSGEEGYGGKRDIYPFLMNGWTPYTLAVVDTPQRWAWPRMQKLVSGIVVLSGLIGYGTATPGTVIFVLPPEYRPDVRLLFPINNGDTPKGIEIRTNGEVVVRGSWVSGTYISLDGIAFPAAGVATWTEIGSAGSGSAFANSWTAYDPANWGAPAFWKDPYGFVWFHGLIGGGSTASDNLLMFSLPTTHHPTKQTHTKAVAQDAFAYVSAIPGAGNGIHWKNGSAGNAWLSLSGTIVASSQADTLDWLTLNLSNGWTTYNSTFPTQQVVRRPDGLAASRGLMKGGTAPAIKISSIPQWMLPEPGIILYGVGSSAFNRQDIIGSRVIEDATAPGQFRVMTGSISWNSWDGHVWMVGD